ncbi:hypothetical protein KC906_02155 [Candidatus Kaiserbacteria bacterium]|nr:hypothetical protein [Candidatus Kaiserbacteria bacterium]
MITIACETAYEHESVYAVLELTAEYAAEIVDMMKDAAALKKDKYPSLFGLEIFNSQVEYYRSFGLDDELDSTGVWHVIDPKVLEDYDPIRTQAETVVASPPSVCWRAYEKHSGAVFETRTLVEEEMLRFFEQLQKGNDDNLSTGQSATSSS